MELDLLGKDYYSAASARRYWSISQYKRFRECEARALAELEGEWEDQRDNTALLVGNMVHSYFESSEAHKKFMDENADAMISKAGKTKGQLKSDFLVGQRMIERLESDKQFMDYYVGQKEVAVTGKIEGVEFKGKNEIRCNWGVNRQTQAFYHVLAYSRTQAEEMAVKEYARTHHITEKWVVIF
ncbi:TPA: PD-(D/E)XK nuclease-like domain-containing protein [Streptococcus pneumoniae]|nr:PD-(D/E)XK nuclease-like domain-containing protein [Streptococcus pneumoniae]HEX0728089.1 PD-(D/E)XK nuclease-like domain-containing protein [Streptococcus pneumoniae]